MFWAILYVSALVLMSVGGFIIDASKRRTPAEFAINVLTVLAPVLLVLAYIEPDLFTYPASILALMGVTVAANYISGRMYLREMNAEMPQDEAVNFWTMLIGIFVLLAPAFWFGASAFARMG